MAASTTLKTDLRALRSMITEADLLLSTTDLPEGRGKRAHELLGTAITLADHLISESPAVSLGKLGGLRQQNGGQNIIGKSQQNAKRKPVAVHEKLKEPLLFGFRLDVTLLKRCFLIRFMSGREDPQKRKCRGDESHSLRKILVSLSHIRPRVKNCVCFGECFCLFAARAIPIVERNWPPSATNTESGIRNLHDAASHTPWRTRAPLVRSATVNSHAAAANRVVCHRWSAKSESDVGFILLCPFRRFSGGFSQPHALRPAWACRIESGGRATLQDFTSGTVALTQATVSSAPEPLTVFLMFSSRRCGFDGPSAT
jgi:hypothetical protein